MSMSLIAVYGTLRENGSNHNIIKMGKSELKGVATLFGFDMFDTGMGFPACVDGAGIITCEVYEVDADTEKCLDVLEGVPHHYIKEKITTPFGEAFIYLYPERSHLKNQIVYGDWMKYTKGK